jgi:polysaccharide export outer membrane protein
MIQRDVLRRLMAFGVVVGWLAIAAARARAEDYVVGPDDVLTVSVWLHPELERTVTISADGNLTLPPVGDIKAAGYTAKQLGDKVADRLSAYLRQTTTVTITVTKFYSHSLYVTGGVANPGRYGFERIPTLVDVLGQAGGALPGSDLSAVQIVRKEGDARRTITADLSAALRTGDPSGLPELKIGDNIVIPGPPSASSATTLGVGVLGEVVKPGVYVVNEGQDIWSVLASAGGLTHVGNWADVRVLTHAEGGQTVARLDLREALEHGSRAPVTVKPGDVVVVMPRGASLWGGFTGLLAMSRDALNLIVLVDYFRNTKSTK